ncbi:hypothetical protein ACFLQX_01735 [Bacteroidota bacterium]
MAFYQFKTEQMIKASLEEVWDFISSPGNLKKITPENMGFEIKSGGYDGKMYEGMLIHYRVKPLLNINTTWVTEISHIKEKQYFIDEQIVGPYKFWHHQHFLEPKDEGILMTDIVSYQPPLGFLGRIANSLFIKRKLKEIFSFRERALELQFGRTESDNIAA